LEEKGGDLRRGEIGKMKVFSLFEALGQAKFRARVGKGRGRGGKKKGSGSG